MTAEPVSIVPVEIDQKPFRRDGLGYIWELKKHQLVFRADYIHRARENVTASIRVESTAPGTQPHVFRGRIGLESPTSQRDLVRFLEDLTKRQDTDDGSGVPWKKIVQGFCAALLNAQENTAEIVHVGNLKQRDQTRWIIERLLAAGKPTIFYGDGSAGKGWLATAICICLATGRPLGYLKVQPAKVLYLDWEDDQWTFNDRVQAICKGWGIEPPDIAYASMMDSFDRNHRWIAQQVTKHGYEVLVIDSVGLAGGTVGERGSYEDVALNLFRQIRSIPAEITTVLIDHVNSEGRTNGDGVPSKGFGSVYKGYLARSTWFVKKDQDMESDVLHMGLYQTKTNHTSTSKPLGFRVTFENRDHELVAARFESEDVRDNPTLSRSLPAWQRIRDYLLSVGRATAPQICDELDLADNAVRSELTRKKNVFVKVGTNEWGVLQHEPGKNITPFRTPYRDTSFADSDDDLPFG